MVNNILTTDLIIAITSSVIVILLSVIAFFLVRFITGNDKDWGLIKKSMNELINTVNLLAHRTGENEDDIKELRAEVRGVPHVKHKNGA